MRSGWRHTRKLTPGRGGASDVTGPDWDFDAPASTDMNAAERRAMLEPQRGGGRMLATSLRALIGATCVAGAAVGLAGVLLPSHASKTGLKPKAEAAASVAGREVSSAFVELASADPGDGASALLAARLKESRTEQAGPAGAPRTDTAAGASGAGAQPAAPVQVASAGEAAMPAATAAAVAPPAVAQSATTMEPAEADALLKRSEAFIAQGDIASARLFLQRAATGGSARAALALGGTFDPVVLRRLQVYGVPGDKGKARDWYEKARELGAAEASGRLEVLARAGE